VSQKKIRVLVAKPGLDGHDRGAKVVARALRDAGMEVIYTGIRQTPEMIVEVALQEDVDVIGLSSLAGAHVELFSEVLDLLKAKKIDNIIVVAGGIIPEDDIQSLQNIGIKAVFGPGTPTATIADTVTKLVAERN
jgi:methylmalonyl-CoA mutase C-terminal domain/subunit